MNTPPPPAGRRDGTNRGSSNSKPRRPPQSRFDRLVNVQSDSVGAVNRLNNTVQQLGQSVLEMNRRAMSLADLTQEEAWEEEVQVVSAAPPTARANTSPVADPSRARDRSADAVNHCTTRFPAKPNYDLVKVSNKHYYVADVDGKRLKFGPVRGGDDVPCIAFGEGDYTPFLRLLGKIYRMVEMAFLADPEFKGVVCKDRYRVYHTNGPYGLVADIPEVGMVRLGGMIQGSRILIFGLSYKYQFGELVME